MAKLTKKQRAAINAALYDAERAARYVFSPSVRVCFAREQATNATDYVPFNGERARAGQPESLTLVEREINLHLCVLREAIRKLKNFLEEDEQ